MRGKTPKLEKHVSVYRPIDRGAPFLVAYTRGVFVLGAKAYRTEEEAIEAYEKSIAEPEPPTPIMRGKWSKPKKL